MLSQKEALKLAYQALQLVLRPAGNTIAYVWDSEEAKFVVYAYQELSKINQHQSTE